MSMHLSLRAAGQTEYAREPGVGGACTGGRTHGRRFIVAIYISSVLGPLRAWAVCSVRASGQSMILD